MSSRHRLCLSAALALLACRFDAAGLGESTGGPATGDSGGESGSGASTTGGGASTTGGEASSGSSGSIGGSASAGTSGAPATCGDGAVDPGEACDDGNTDDDDACRSDCTPPARCGDAQLDRGEACDDGNDHDDDACVACQKARCGDGFVQKHVESCDDGPESAACNADCSLAKCGDSKLNAAAGEVCDLGAQNGAYAGLCSADCKGEGPRCGDGVLDLPDEKCEPSKPPPDSTCTADCQSLVCAPGRGNCDEDFANGCETDIAGDEDNCGECGKHCDVFSCKEGACKP